MIRRVPVAPVQMVYWKELLPCLTELGRTDLVAVIETKLAKARRVQKWHDETGWNGSLRRLDRWLFGERLLALRQRLLSSRSR